VAYLERCSLKFRLSCGGNADRLRTGWQGGVGVTKGVKKNTLVSLCSKDDWNLVEACKARFVSRWICMKLATKLSQQGGRGRRGGCPWQKYTLEAPTERRQEIPARRYHSLPVTRVKTYRNLPLVAFLPLKAVPLIEIHSQDDVTLACNETTLCCRIIHAG
jgi:hypothetical protein